MWAERIRSEKGSILIETVAVCLVLVVIFVACIELFGLITTDIYIYKVAREGGREAALTNSTGTGEAKARDVANQYLP